MKQRVTGIGGIFFKSKDPKALAQWYQTHLGIPIEAWGGAAFRWGGEHSGTTIWNAFSADTGYFAPSSASFMVNYRVEDLHALMAALRDEGVQIEGEIQESEYGKFGWVMDPEGNKLELWEPPAGS